MPADSVMLRSWRLVATGNVAAPMCSHVDGSGVIRRGSTHKGDQGHNELNSRVEPILFKFFKEALTIRRFVRPYLLHGELLRPIAVSNEDVPEHHASLTAVSARRRAMAIRARSSSCYLVFYLETSRFDSIYLATGFLQTILTLWSKSSQIAMAGLSYVQPPSAELPRLITT